MKVVQNVLKTEASSTYFMFLLLTFLFTLTLPPSNKYSFCAIQEISKHPLPYLSFQYLGENRTEMNK